MSKSFFFGTISGKTLKCRELAAWISKQKDGEKIEIFVEAVKGKRSDHANRFIWSALMEAIANHTGHTKEEIHAFCEDKFADRHYVQVGNENRLVMRTCSTLKSGEFQEFIQKIKMWAIEELDFIFQENA